MNCSHSSGSGFDFSNSNYNYDNRNTNTSSHLCENSGINPANTAKKDHFLKSAGNVKVKAIL